MQTITLEQLRQALAEGRVEQIFDNRGPGSFGTLHIKGAKLLPVSEVKTGLPPDRDAMLVFY
ncbi:MAG: hypothetical protein ICCCNLDF_02681 [Planctomycetes bacterium]|nr:hypothetical protein [Planctomycetota bacterium]